MNLGLNYYGHIFIKKFGGVFRTIASYKSIKITVWLLVQGFLEDHN